VTHNSLEHAIVIYLSNLLLKFHYRQRNISPLESVLRQCCSFHSFIHGLDLFLLCLIIIMAPFSSCVTMYIWKVSTSQFLHFVTITKYEKLILRKISLRNYRKPSTYLSPHDPFGKILLVSKVWISYIKMRIQVLNTHRTITCFIAIYGQAGLCGLVLSPVRYELNLYMLCRRK
jgi:hypothetical protein